MVLKRSTDIMTIFKLRDFMIRCTYHVPCKSKHYVTMSSYTQRLGLLNRRIDIAEKNCLVRDRAIGTNEKKVASSSVNLARCTLHKDAFCQSSFRRIYYHGNPPEKKLSNHTSVHCVAYTCAVWPVYEVKCLYSSGWE